MKWKADTAHSIIEFTVRHMALTNVRGRFTEFTGEGETDAQGRLKRVTLQIQSSSLNTANEMRDAHLRSADFFEVDRYPVIQFESTEIKDLSPNRYEVTGNLDMHGIVKSMTLVLTTTNPVRDMQGEVRVGGQAQGTFRRKDWGLVWNQMLDLGGMAVSDEVWFAISIQALPESAPNYRVRWALTDATDSYQFTLRYGRNHRVQSTLQGVTGWFDILDGRPSALDVEFPVSELQLPTNQLPAVVSAFLSHRQKVNITASNFELVSSGIYQTSASLKVGSLNLPLHLTLENINLPSGSSNNFTARVAVSLAPTAVAQLVSTYGVGAANTLSSELQATLWFMAQVRQEEAQMAL